MFPIINVDEWVEDMEKGIGTGNREKIWLINKDTGARAMFKLPREGTGEHWAEKLSSEIAKAINFPCAEVDLALRGGKIGCLSYFFVDAKNGYSHYDCGTYFPHDYDFDKNQGYTFDLLKSVLESDAVGIDHRDFFLIVVFDALISNGDRHQDNFGITRHEKSHKVLLSPLYDNSASLGRDLSEKTIDHYLKQPQELIRHLYRGKSKIGLGETRNVNHFKFIKFLSEKYTNEMKILFEHLIVLTDNKIKSILNQFPNIIINNDKKEFLYQFIKNRRDILLKIGEEMNTSYDKLLLIWKDPIKRMRFVVGKLEFISSNNLYRFSYINPDLDEAVLNGFKNFPNFPDLEKVYEVENNLFKSIKSRLPQPKRPDYPLILNRYHLSPANTDMEILAATRGRVATDTFEFIPDIRYTPGSSFDITFDLAGARYSDYTQIKDHLFVGEQVSLSVDKDNEYDPFAVNIFVKGNSRLGRVPKYYSKEIHTLITQTSQYEALIAYLDIENINQDEWVKIRIKVSV